ncbi:hypothetical protein AYO40_03750 [Planctomycetaceae bacterium SCGC AG-212-D15]|nr:hypothetical protein AYO40_03750 [Planctomycetaceae bacterium SCGC AG-212-D15]
MLYIARRIFAAMKRSSMLGLSLAVLGWPLSAARADFVVSTPSGLVDLANEPLSAQVTFNQVGNTLTVTLQNLVVNPTSVGQDVTGLTFKLGTAETATLTSSSGTARTLSFVSPGVYSYSDVAVPGDTGWRFPGSTTSATGTQFTLDWFDRNKLVTGPNAQYTLIGQPGSDGFYHDPNSSLLGGSHAPELATSLTFNLALSSSAPVTISDIQWEFGTTDPGDPGHLDPGHLVPLPPSLLLSLTGVGCIGITLMYRRRAA